MTSTAIDATRGHQPAIPGAATLWPCATGNRQAGHQPSAIAKLRASAIASPLWLLPCDRISVALADWLIPSLLRHGMPQAHTISHRKYLIRAGVACTRKRKQVVLAIDQMAE